MPSDASDCYDQDAAPAPPMHEEDKKSIISRQLARQMLTAITKGKPSSFAHQHVAVTFAEVTARKCWTERKEERREKTLMSTFDVDGPCTIATPYNPEWEILPRPELRSMSTCWVVDTKANIIKDATLTREDGLTAHLQSQGKEKGKEKDYKSTDLATDSDDVNTSRAIDSIGDQGLDCTVLRKVRGLWQIIDLPSQQYNFC